MNKIILFLFLIFTFTVTLVSFSQDDDYEYSNGTYMTNIKNTVTNDVSNENIKIEAVLAFETKKDNYLLGVVLMDMKGWTFDIVNNKFSVDLDTETMKPKADPNHTAIDLSGFCFNLTVDDMLKFSNSEKIILNVILIKTDKDKNKEVPVNIDLKPEKTKVYLDFYNLSTKK